MEIYCNKGKSLPKKKVQQHSYRFIKKTDFIGETQLLVNQQFSLWWPKANQLAIYKHDRGAELGTTENKSSSRLVRALNLEPPDDKPILLIVLGYLYIWMTWRLVKPLHSGPYASAPRLVRLSPQLGHNRPKNQGTMNYLLTVCKRYKRHRLSWISDQK